MFGSAKIYEPLEAYVKAVNTKAPDIADKKTVLETIIAAQVNTVNYYREAATQTSTGSEIISQTEDRLELGLANPALRAPFIPLDPQRTASDLTTFINESLSPSRGKET
jgi:hypothetical protein